MSGDPTQNIEEKYATKPTLETILERINVLANGVDGLREGMRAGFAQVDTRLDRLEMRIKKVENSIGVLNENLPELRGDMRELKNSLKAHEPR